MKIFSWVHNKLAGNKSNPNIPNSYLTQLPCKEEFSDWPHGLLAIGTFGNKIKEEAENANLQENFPSTKDHLNLHGLNLTVEEVGKLQIELNLIFEEHVGGRTSANLDALNLPFDKLLDTNSSTDAKERDCSSCPDGSNNKNDNHLQCYSTSLVNSGGKDVGLDYSKAAIGKRSLSFLLKKMFVCSSGFSPAPSLRDPIVESRMEMFQMLKTILHKKIYPQSCSPKLSTKKSLESTHFAKDGNRDEKGGKVDDGSKWVKTDSEYIVLEI